MIGALLMAAGTGFNILSAIQHAQVAKRQAEFFSNQARASATIAEELGAADEAVMDRQQKFRQGQIVGGYAASGVETNTGSPMFVLSEQVRLDAYARMRRGYQAQLQAHDLRVSAASSDYRGSVAIQQGILSALGAGLSGAANMAGAKSDTFAGPGFGTDNGERYSPFAPSSPDFYLRKPY